MPRLAYALVSGIALASATIVAAGWLFALHSPDWTWWGAALLLAAVLIAEAGAVEITRELDPHAQAGYALSIATIPHLAAALLLPPWAAALLGGLGMLIDEVRGRSPWPRLVFNVSVTGGSLGLTALLADRLGLVGNLVGSGDWRQVLALFVVAATYYACNAVTMAAIASVMGAGGFFEQLAGNVRTSAAAEFALAMVGGIVAFVWVTQPYWLLVGVFPAAISQLTFRIMAAHNRKVAQLAALDRLGRELSAGLSVEAVFRTASAHLSQSRGVDGCFLVAPEMELACFDGLADGRSAQAVARRLIERARERDTTIWVRDLATDPAAAATDGRPASSWVVLPLASGDQPIGHFGIVAEGAHAFNAGDVEFFGLVAERVDLALEAAERTSELVRMAYHDPLTGLPNRALLLDRLEQLLLRSERSAAQAAVLLLDLDNFKVINDSLGHQVGDALLCQVADALRRSVRPSDTVARLGGDEFTILLPDVAGQAGATEVAQRIAAHLQASARVADHTLVVSTSIGVALSQPGDRPESLLRAADLALYKAKANGRSQHAFFDPGMESQVLERLELEAALRLALDRGELTVFYQPIVRLATRAIVGWEALVRWHHPQRGLVSPAAFIPVAEETGLIVDIGEQVLSAACRQARTWQQTVGDDELFMAVNVSGRQFQQTGLVATVERCLAEAGLAPRALKLEITESAVMGDAAAAVRTLGELKRLGVQLAIDDFGTGYSSLAYLKQFPVDTLKIDRAFVDGLSHNPQDTAIVRSIVALASTLGLSVTAEGIETPGQHTQLTLLDCEYGQGYLYGRPLSAEHAQEALLASRRVAAA